MENDLLGWLEPRMVDVPDSLRTRILDTVKSRQSDRLTGGRLSEELRRIGEELMRSTQSAPATRDTAMTLLAADALMTFACEAVAEGEPERLSELQ